MHATLQQRFEVEGFTLDEVTEDMHALHELTSITSRHLDRLGITHTQRDAIELAQGFLHRWIDWQMVDLHRACCDPAHPRDILSTPIPSASAMPELRALEHWTTRTSATGNFYGVTCREDAQDIFYTRHGWRYDQELGWIAP